MSAPVAKAGAGLSPSQLQHLLDTLRDRHATAVRSVRFEEATKNMRKAAYFRGVSDTLEVVESWVTSAQRSQRNTVPLSGR